MADTRSGKTRRPAGRASSLLVAIWVLAGIFGVAAVGLAAWGWTLELPELEKQSDFPVIDIAIRSIKVLLLSDIYYNPASNAFAGKLLEIARACGVVFSILVALRLLLFAAGARLSEFFYRLGIGNHDLIVGVGPAAAEYSSFHSVLFPKKRRAIHLAEERLPTSARLATFVRTGNLDWQLRTGAAKRARRILVDEGDDSDTWHTAQAIARRYRDIEILAHITDPWMRERLSREEGTFGLSAFSYAAGAARQVMLAHPPYLLARKLNAAAQHVMIVGFGQVGQAIAREFVVTCVTPDIAPMIVTVVDPDAVRLGTDFKGRHPDLGQHIDFEFIAGDFRMNDPALIAQVAQRSAKAEICAVYVAIDDANRPLSLALSMRASAMQSAMFRAPIFVCAQHGAGLTEVRHGTGLVGAAGSGASSARKLEVERQATVDGVVCDLQVVSFGSWEDAFDGAGLIEDRFDGQAKQFHDQYEKLVAEQAKESDPSALPPPQQSWATLPDQLRVSSRRTAAHIRTKAHAAKYDLESWLESQPSGWRTHELPPASETFLLNDAGFMLLMAQLEHRRWMLDRFLDGWAIGDRDNYSRRRPDLVAFEKLGGGAVDKDRAVIRTAAAILAARGTNGSKR
jgi:hypothetical protein